MQYFVIYCLKLPCCVTIMGFHDLLFKSYLMKKTLLFLSLLGVGSILTAQEVKFEEYDLANGCM